MQIHEIKPGIAACLTSNETANAGYVETKRGVIVVDTLDCPARGQDLAAAIAERTKAPILLVFNTHYHYDHTFGNQAFAAPVIAHCALAENLAGALAVDLAPEALDEWLAESPEDHWLVDELQITYPSIAFHQRLVADLEPFHLVLQHIGGHTTDSSVMDLPEEGVLFAGDLVFEGRVPYRREAHIGRTVAGLRQLEQLGDRTIVPGHGALCDMSYVTRTRTYLETLLDAVGQMVKEGLETWQILASERLPQWWTDDRPDLLQADVARAVEECRRG